MCLAYPCTSWRCLADRDRPETRHPHLHELVVTAQELAGIAMVSERAVRDSYVDLLAEVQRNLRTYFGRVLDDWLLHGRHAAGADRRVLVRCRIRRRGPGGRCPLGEGRHHHGRRHAHHAGTASGGERRRGGRLDGNDRPCTTTA
jgi:hypothetical protein